MTAAKTLKGSSPMGTKRSSPALYEGSASMNIPAYLCAGRIASMISGNSYAYGTFVKSLQTDEFRGNVTVHQNMRAQEALAKVM